MIARESQKNIVTRRLREVEALVIDRIDSGEIPEDWSGFELQWLLRDILLMEAPSAEKQRRRFDSYCQHRHELVGDMTGREE
jgi:hypothetical protein